MMKRLFAVLAGVVVLSTTTTAWGPQGHRLVAMIASNHLTSVARQNVASLLGPSTLADVATWADDHIEGNSQTASWHYVNIPPFASAYKRERDCPTQPGITAGSGDDKWRDCIVDRILYHEGRLADPSLDRVDRAVSLKFLVHFVGDLHQPFHALGVERGGNGIHVIAFGATTCSQGHAPGPCNLHSLWDTSLIAHRKLDDLQYLATLQQQIRQRNLDKLLPGTPEEWAMESHALARAALVPGFSKIDNAYYSEHIRVIDDRLAIGGLRLAAMLNAALGTRTDAENAQKPTPNSQGTLFHGFLDSQRQPALGDHH